MKGPVVAYIGLGSNMGDVRANLRKALKLLGTSPGIEVWRVASSYRSEPQGYVNQDWFLNSVAELRTVLGAQDLLAALLAVEAAMGRVRTVRWGPRVIDLDLLLYGEEKIDSPDLTVPHPRLWERAFVLVPLAELVPGLELSPGRRALDLAARLAKEQALEKVD